MHSTICFNAATSETRIEQWDEARLCLGTTPVWNFLLASVVVFSRLVGRYIPARQNIAQLRSNTKIRETLIWVVPYSVMLHWFRPTLKFRYSALYLRCPLPARHLGYGQSTSWPTTQKSFRPVTIANYTLETIDKFTYLGSTITVAQMLRLTSGSPSLPLSLPSVTRESGITTS